ncbi:MAG: D-2-hydroxyacid dehydrogenase [Xanthomonadales bacterium]|jgi:phosphoglycerate dehydrogenase-like enzyme|nr:D-2-hydroxyacid dehydrogenase [Xanthomonadales bacterium]
MTRASTTQPSRPPGGTASGPPSADLQTLLILDRDAEEYAERLSDLSRGPLQLLHARGPEDLPEAASGASVVLGEPGLVAAAWKRLPALTWVQSTWAGVTPLLPLAKQGVTVTGVKAVFGAQMAEYVLGGLLRHVLKMPEREMAQRARRWWPEPTGTLEGLTLGVMGTGSIGSVIGERARAFGMRVIGFSRSGSMSKDGANPFDRVYPGDALHAFLGACDHVAAVLPDTPATRGLLDEAAFASLRPGAVLINVGRGTLISEAALLSALESGRLGGVLLDVFETEPLPKDHPFWDAPGLVLTAHVAARSWPKDIAAIFRENLQRYLAGAPLRFRVDPERGY